MIIVALVGMPKAGKGVVSEALEGRGYTPISMSSVLHEQILRDYPEDPVRRDCMFIRALEYRRQNGPAYLGELCLSRAYELAEQGINRFVVDGIRHPAELSVLMQNGAIPTGIICDFDREQDYKIREKRFKENALQRGIGFEDPKKFKKINDREWSNEDSMAPQIGVCLSMVLSHKGKLFINGEGKSVQELQREVNEFATTLEGVRLHPERR